MRQVKHPVIDDEQVYDQIAAAKRGTRRTRLQEIRAVIMGAYQEYANAAPDVAHLDAVHLSKNQVDALIHAYSVETKPLAGMRQRLTQPVILARCPFCGIGEASTLDHYLPKEEHPQFAVFSRNLVPCCSPCNTRKSELVLDAATDVRLFLHPYFDLIPEVQFLTAQITLLPSALRVSFRLQHPRGVHNEVFQQLQHHFRLLRLADRYSVNSLELLRSERKAFERFYGPQKDAVRVAAELAQKADDFEEDFGTNHWRVVLFRALAEHHQFCDGGFRILTQIQ